MSQSPLNLSCPSCEAQLTRTPHGVFCLAEGCDTSRVIICAACFKPFDPSDLSQVFLHEHARLTLPVLARRGGEVAR